MIIQHIADTHGFHNGLWINVNEIDMIIHSGDAANYQESFVNEKEMREFLTWYSNLDVEYKIYVAGNHDTSVEKGLITKENFEQCGIIYLENDWIEIEGLKIYGSPITPTYGNWAFMKARHKMHRWWQHIPDDIDILITHGPPKGILDLTETYPELNLFQCGDKALLNRVLEIEPKLHCFGHIHNNPGNKATYNSGTFKMANYDTIFSNGACVTDRKFNQGITSHGNIINLK